MAQEFMVQHQRKLSRCWMLYKTLHQKSLLTSYIENICVDAGEVFLPSRRLYQLVKDGIKIKTNPKHIVNKLFSRDRERIIEQKKKSVRSFLEKIENTELENVLDMPDIGIPQWTYRHSRKQLDQLAFKSTTERIYYYTQ